MKLVMTLVVRDEADVIDAHLTYHLDAGVDLVIATDHRSSDGTTDVLRRYAREGHLQLFEENEEFIRQSEWQTSMSRLAAREHGADWVIPSDADEFWWPRGGSLKDALEAVPPRYGTVRALSRNFIPTREGDGWFGERLTIRLAMDAPINDPASTFRPVIKVAHRGHPDVAFPKGGAHHVSGLAGSLPSDSPLEILHMPFRSREQCAWKYKRTWTGWRENIRGDLARARALTTIGRADEIWDRVTVDDEMLAQGLAQGSLVRDTRLRDHFRALGITRGGATVTAQNVGETSPTADDVAYAVDLAVFDEAEVVRAARRVDEAGARVAKLETRASRRRRRPWARSAVARGVPAR